MWCNQSDSLLKIIRISEEKKMRGTIGRFGKFFVDMLKNATDTTKIIIAAHECLQKKI